MPFSISAQVLWLDVKIDAAWSPECGGALELLACVVLWVPWLRSEIARHPTSALQYSATATTLLGTTECFEREVVQKLTSMNSCDCLEAGVQTARHGLVHESQVLHTLSGRLAPRTDHAGVTLESCTRTCARVYGFAANQSHLKKLLEAARQKAEL